MGTMAATRPTGPKPDIQTIITALLNQPEYDPAPWGCYLSAAAVLDGPATNCRPTATPSTLDLAPWTAIWSWGGPSLAHSVLLTRWTGATAHAGRAGSGVSAVATSAARSTMLLRCGVRVREGKRCLNRQVHISLTHIRASCSQKKQPPQAFPPPGVYTGWLVPGDCALAA